jgi:cell division protein FtsB
MAEHPNTDVELALLRADMDQMKEDMKALRQEIKDLVDAWKTATNVLAFVKWLAGIGTAAAFLWAAIKAKFGV